MNTSTIATRFLLLSDTHGEPLQNPPTEPVDVAIHCGDLTEESKLEEFRTSLRLLESLNASLKLVIAGNHDFTLDVPVFKKKLDEMESPLDEELVHREYGAFGEARQLFNSNQAKTAGIVFLKEGIHKFELANGAALTVYASPYTPSLSDWGFSYSPQQIHDWKLNEPVDVVVTHGPPRGILDYTDARQRSGSPSLFAAVARSRPLLHCFGHIHEGWGAKQVTWYPEPTESPSHFTDINNDRSTVIASLSGITVKQSDEPDIAAQKNQLRNKYEKMGYCTANMPLQRGMQTLFVNAAIESLESNRQQLPWIVKIELPATESLRQP